MGTTHVLGQSLSEGCSWGQIHILVTEEVGGCCWSQDERGVGSAGGVTRCPLDRSADEVLSSVEAAVSRSVGFFSE